MCSGHLQDPPLVWASIFTLLCGAGCNGWQGQKTWSSQLLADHFGQWTNRAIGPLEASKSSEYIVRFPMGRGEKELGRVKDILRTKNGLEHGVPGLNWRGSRMFAKGAPLRPGAVPKAHYWHPRKMARQGCGRGRRGKGNMDGGSSTVQKSQRQQKQRCQKPGPRLGLRRRKAASSLTGGRMQGQGKGWWWARWGLRRSWENWKEGGSVRQGEERSSHVLLSLARPTPSLGLNLNSPLRCRLQLVARAQDVVISTAGRSFWAILVMPLTLGEALPRAVSFGKLGRESGPSVGGAGIDGGKMERRVWLLRVGESDEGVGRGRQGETHAQESPVSRYQVLLLQRVGSSLWREIQPASNLIDRPGKHDKKNYLVLADGMVGKKWGPPNRFQEALANVVGWPVAIKSGLHLLGPKTAVRGCVWESPLSHEFKSIADNRPLCSDTAVAPKNTATNLQLFDYLVSKAFAQTVRVAVAMDWP
ncbi:hypothetical protein BDK51DRAFT_26828 [Blyttiomyces helicus]|uniref:Uncharacterized protein n=1 Tax=Blyttiomyces helicus TaxID=388810 RepID=A0A4P9WEM0_9FUNG|nr:hypothetical protein BDK51DRAFT_26828 [Blyttiomyces helicus]|eukprot:RKO91171.1 hypothetical protein BDK51DRAFT_26828 [Blyttiomyces helicus]